MRAIVGAWLAFGCTALVEAGQSPADTPPPGAGDSLQTTQAEVLTRDGAGRVTIRAVRLRDGLQFDGRLDEEIYTLVSPASGFIQQLPDEGALATQRTDVWVLYDDANLYVSARCWDMAPQEDWVANELRRDGSQINQNDSFGVLLDTFHDRRNGVLFYTNPIGALADQQITDERAINADWNPVWDVKTDRASGAWTVEMQIPFKSLRYGPGSLQTWGIQLRRVVRRINEWSFIAPVPISATNQGTSQGILRVSDAATLVDLEVPAGSKNLEVKPYGIVESITNPAADPPRLPDTNGDAGFDVKYGVTQNLTADLTYNTDFAQVEVDDQQVNLTRFSLFFPEKREFFLESRGIFDFGGPGGFQSAAPVMFYSRRIGLDDGRQVPIVAGGRVTGKAGACSVGALNIQTDSVSPGVVATNFTVARIKRDIFRRSSIGGLFTRRSRSTAVDGSNQAFGLDASLSFFDNLNLDAYVAKTATPGLEERDTSYQVRFDYPGDRYKMIAEHLLVGRHFNPEAGFLSRENVRRTFAEVAFTPRPSSMPAIRQFVFESNIDYTVTADTGMLETRSGLFSFEIERENSDRFEFDIIATHERIDEAFDVAGGTVPPGTYDFRHVEVVYTFGGQRPASGSVTFRRGGFYGGDFTVLNVTQGRVKVTDRLVVEPRISLNWLDLPAGSFSTALVGTRASYSFTPRMYFSSLLQFNSESHAFSTNLRFRWEYRPGSEVFVVLTEERDTEALSPIGLKNRGFVFKVNRLFRF